LLGDLRQVLAHRRPGKIDDPVSQGPLDGIARSESGEPEERAQRGRRDEEGEQHEPDRLHRYEMPHFRRERPVFADSEGENDGDGAPKAATEYDRSIAVADRTREAECTKDGEQSVKDRGTGSQ